MQWEINANQEKKSSGVNEDDKVKSWTQIESITEMRNHSNKSTNIFKFKC